MPRPKRRPSVIRYAIEDGSIVDGMLKEAAQRVATAVGCSIGTALRRLRQSPLDAGKLYAAVLTAKQYLLKGRAAFNAAFPTGIVMPGGSVNHGGMSALISTVVKATGCSRRAAHTRIRMHADNPAKLFAKAVAAPARRKRETLSDLCTELDARKRAMKGGHDIRAVMP